MSDDESIMMDAIYDQMIDEQRARKLADDKEQVEAAIIELDPMAESKGLLTYPADTYGETFNAAAMALIDAVQHKTGKEQRNRCKGGTNSGQSRTEAAAERLQRRQEVADGLFESGQYAFKKDAAREVLRREIAYRRSDRDVYGMEKTPDSISDEEEERILDSKGGYLARQLKGPTKQP